MILYLDTSGPACRLWLDDTSYEWRAERDLARGLLKFIRDCLLQDKATWEDLAGLAFMIGPGSFTGLRIGATVLNTVADAQNIPIVGVCGKDWRLNAKKQLGEGEGQKLVLPNYGAAPNITTPKK